MVCAGATLTAGSAGGVARVRWPAPSPGLWCHYEAMWHDSFLAGGERSVLVLRPRGGDGPAPGLGGCPDTPCLRPDRGALLEPGKKPEPPPAKKKPPVVVPGRRRVRGERGGYLGRVPGDDVIAVTVCFAGHRGDTTAAVSFCGRWSDCHPDGPLLTRCTRRRLVIKPVVHDLRRVEAEDRCHRLLALIPQAQPARPRLCLLGNQRGVIPERAIRRGTVSVAPCRLCDRPGRVASRDAARALALGAASVSAAARAPG